MTSADLDKRIDRLEVNVRRLQALLLLALLVLPLGAARMLVDDADEIRSKKFTLVDSDGNECGWWLTKPNKSSQEGLAGIPHLTFFSREGLQVSLMGGPNPHLGLNGGGAEGDRRNAHVKLGMSPAEGPGLSLWGQCPLDGELATRETNIGVPWTDDPAFLEVKDGNSVVYINRVEGK